MRGATGANGLSAAVPSVDLWSGDAVTIAVGTSFAECAAVVLRLAPGERIEVLLGAQVPRRPVVAAA